MGREPSLFGHDREFYQRIGGPGVHREDGALNYARYAVSERFSVWGLAGWGTGTLTLTAKGAEEE